MKRAIVVGGVVVVILAAAVWLLGRSDDSASVPPLAVRGTPKPGAVIGVGIGAADVADDNVALHSCFLLQRRTGSDWETTHLLSDPIEGNESPAEFDGQCPGRSRDGQLEFSLTLPDDLPPGDWRVVLVWTPVAAEAPSVLRAHEFVVP